MKIIETERLILRIWKQDDLESFAQLNSDPNVMEYMPKCLNKAETETFHSRIQAHIQRHGFGLFACELKETNKFIGYVGLNIPSFEAHFTPCVEIGWRLSFDYWGKGYATEAARAVLSFAFENLALDEVVSFTVPNNLRSRKVMEKIGMKRDSKDDFHHPLLSKSDPLSLHVLYKLKKDDYAALLSTATSKTTPHLLSF